MLEIISEYFKKYPAQEKVAKLLMRYGLRVKPEGIFCGEIKIPEGVIAEACDIDSRVVSATINTILKHEKLTRIFSKLLPVAHLKDVAPHLGWGVLEVSVSSEADRPGILANIVTIIAKANVNIQQVVVERTVAPPITITIITETPVPGNTIHFIKNAQGVKSVTLY
ncbi:MAG: ACT domain-containing protein [Candidatus Thermoplasmatota archaeon]